jgi:hypothetical protein
MTLSCPRSLTPFLALLIAGFFAMPGTLRAQDSFVREVDFMTGRPLLSVLGSGIGQRPASLTVEFSCPDAEVLRLDLRGTEFPDGAPITLDLGGPDGGWHEVRLLSVQRPDADWLRLAVDEASFRVALVRARGADAAPDSTAAVLQVGQELGVAIGLDGLAREIGDLAHDCAVRRLVQGATPVARYTR